MFKVSAKPAAQVSNLESRVFKSPRLRASDMFVESSHPNASLSLSNTKTFGACPDPYEASLDPFGARPDPFRTHPDPFRTAI